MGLEDSFSGGGGTQMHFFCPVLCFHKNCVFCVFFPGNFWIYAGKFFEYEEILALAPISPRGQKSSFSHFSRHQNGFSLCKVENFHGEANNFSKFLSFPGLAPYSWKAVEGV